jgi:hypothetical protein
MSVVQDVTVHGPATAEELAAVLAVLAALPSEPPAPSAYDRWRRTRRGALRVSPRGTGRPN